MADTLLTTGNVADSGQQDNATATATLTAPAGSRCAVLGCVASFSATVSAVKTITFSIPTVTGTATVVVDWNFANGPAIVPLPGPVTVVAGGSATCALAASGTPGTKGRVGLFYNTLP